MKSIRKMFSRNIKNSINYFFGFRYDKEFLKYKNMKKIIHVSIPVHGNMGDQAIVYATNKYLRNEFSEYEIIEIYRKDIYKYAKSIKRILNNDDIIVLIGGGNMGNLWLDEEVDRRFIIQEFSNNKIISMPQTISFTKDIEGEKELEKTKTVYNNHNNLTVIAREKKSYEIMKREFTNCNILLNPDIVLYLFDTKKHNTIEKNRIMTCIRNDKESIIGDSKTELLNGLREFYGEIYEYDTVINKSVIREIREKELMNMLDEFRKSKVVITDRLHGMVFAAITRTPCIVTKSFDYKVTGTYEWIKDLNYIKFVDKFNIDEIKQLIEELNSLEKLNSIDLNELYFNKLMYKIQ